MKEKVGTVVDGVRTKVEDARARRAERRAEEDAESADMASAETAPETVTPVEEPEVEVVVEATPAPKKKHKKTVEA